MQNFVKSGDLVKYHRQNAELDQLGFIFGRIYKIEALEGNLILKNETSQALFVENDELTDAAYYFTKTQCPLVLSRGI